MLTHNNKKYSCYSSSSQQETSSSTLDPHITHVGIVTSLSTGLPVAEFVVTTVRFGITHHAWESNPGITPDSREAMSHGTASNATQQT